MYEAQSEGLGQPSAIAWMQLRQNPRQPKSICQRFTGIFGALLCGAFRTAFSISSRRNELSFWRCFMVGATPNSGGRAANPQGRGTHLALGSKAGNADRGNKMSESAGRPAVTIYDCTLRDGAQGRGSALSPG